MTKQSSLTRSRTHQLLCNWNDDGPAWNLTVTWRQGHVLVQLAQYGFVVAWQTHVAAGAGNVVLMQRLDARGAALGEPVQVNPDPCEQDLWVAVTQLEDSRFAVLWRERETQTNFGWGQRFDRDGGRCGHPRRFDLPSDCVP